MGEIRISIPCKNMGNPYLVCKKKFHQVTVEDIYLWMVKLLCEDV